jgi:hypothetical protein
MTETLNYAPLRPRRYSKPLAFFAAATFLYPLLVISALYGEWLLAWFALGHPPQPSLNDPKSIDGSSWMHGITGFALLGIFPVALLALALNVAHIALNRPSAARGAARIVGLVVLWLAILGLLRWDPLQVIYWWLD